jgi:hypothetical protein
MPTPRRTFRSTLRRQHVFAAAVALAGLFVACSSGSSRQCNVGADCASGACNADGTCVPVASATGDASAKEGGPVEGDGAAASGEAGPEDSAAPDFDAGGCLPNNDGTITAAEVPLTAGLKATFRVATNETIDTAGTMNPDGTRTWDFTGKLGSDQDVIVETLSPTGAWWAKDFKTATYSSKLSQSQTPLGVFNVGTSALSLQGVVSPTSDGVTETELTYATPIPILKFPFMKGSSWTTTSNVTGTLNGVASVYTEKYESSVDAAGTVKTPFASFQALRVGTVLTQTVGVVVTTTRTFAWVTECYGTIAKATSTSNETTAEFTQAAELMRITQ